MISQLLTVLKPSSNPDEVVNERIRYIKEDLEPRLNKGRALQGQHKRNLEDMYNGYVMGKIVRRGTNTPL